MSSNKSLRGSVTSGFVWSLLERLSAQGVSLVVSIVLARILDPSNYGIIAIVNIFTTFCTTFVISGFGTALIQKKDADELDFNSIFFTNIAISVVLYAVLFFAAPLISRFYEIAELTLLVRVMALVLPMSALCAIQNAYLQKNMQFKKYFIVTLSCTVFSGIIGIIAALNGAGVWALAVQILSKQALDVVLLYIISSWKPKFEYSFKRVKKLFPFGIKVLCTSLIMNLEAEIRGLIIGKAYSKEDLAFYNNGATYPKLIFLNIGNAITRVMLPVFSKEQNDMDMVRGILRRSVQISLFVVMPLLAGLIAVAKPMVLLLYGEKWALSIPFIQIISLSYLTQPYENSCKEALLATGHSGIILMNMIITKIISFATIICAVVFFDTVYAIAWTSVLWTLVSVVIYALEVSHYFGYSIWSQIKDSVPSLLISAIMCGIVHSVQYWINAPMLVILIMQIIVGAVVYVLLAWILRLDSFKYLTSYAKDIIKKQRK